MKSTAFCLLFLLSLFSAPRNAECQAKPNSISGDFSKEEKELNSFALSLYRQLSSSADGNLFLSPSSIETALSMTLSGAANNTEKQMAEVLALGNCSIQQHNQSEAGFEKHLNSIAKKEKLTLANANSLWPQSGFRISRQWLDDMKKFYGVSITPVNYRSETEEARRTINRWVERKTNDRIRELVKQGIIDSMTRLTLVNAIYFKGDWELPFKQENSFTGEFSNGREHSINCTFMHQKASFRYGELEEAQILELPYSGKDLSMIVLLPREGRTLRQIEASLVPERLAEWEKSLTETKTEVFLPRFKTASGFRLDKTLQEMGMTDAFDVKKADFSKMVEDSSKLYIGAVVHKAFIDVNEKGSEAAAATAVIMQLKSALPTPVPVFRADHPFLFIIRENSGSRILFIGRIVNPADMGG